MNSTEKIKINITLDEWGSKMLRRAIEICSGEDVANALFKHDKQRFVKLALWAFSRGVINAKKEGKKIGGLVVLTADLRPETPAEMEDRIKKIIPGEQQHADWEMPNRWN